MKHAIIVTGYPGSGKSTLSKFIEENSKFSHIDYDLYVNKPEFLIQKETEFIIYDGVHFNNDRLAMSLSYFIGKGYDITLIYLNTNKNKCLENIISRKRPTIEINNLDISYDFNLLEKSFKFNTLQITDYKLDKFNSKFKINNKEYSEIEAIVKKYEDNNRYRITS